MTASWDIRIPWQLYNTLSIFIAALLLLWLIHAIRRFYKVLNLRIAVLSARLVQVRGLGSYLEYFSSATASHVNHMIHTRQVEPPTQVRSLYIPFSLHSVKIQRSFKGVIFELDLWCGVPCRILILSRLSLDVLKRRAAMNSFEMSNSESNERDNKNILFATSQEKPASISPTHAASKRVSPGTSSAAAGSMHRSGIKWVDRLRQRVPDNKTHFLQRSGCCAWASASQDVAAGASTLKMTVEAEIPLYAAAASLARTKSSNQNEGEEGLRDSVPAPSVAPALDSEDSITLIVQGDSRETTSGQSADEIVSFGILIIPMETSARPMYKSNMLPPHLAAGQYADSMTPSTSDGSPTSLTNSLTELNLHSKSNDSNPHHDSYVSDSELAMLEFGLVVIAAPVKSMLPSGAAANDNNETAQDSTPLIPTEFIMSANGGTLYSAVEIFGLNSPQHTQGFLGAALTSPEKLKREATAASPSSGLRGDDECVVCLENSKEILLLPCRHMCICSTCLTQIDKCPVCRSPFEEYIAMLKEPTGQDEDTPDEDVGSGLAKASDFVEGKDKDIEMNSASI